MDTITYIPLSSLCSFFSPFIHTFHFQQQYYTYHSHFLTTNLPIFIAHKSISSTHTTISLFQPFVNYLPRHINTKTQLFCFVFFISISMAFFDQSPRHSLVPGFLYSSNALSHLDSSSINKSINHAGLPPSSHSSSSLPSRSHEWTRKNIPMIPSPNESIPMFSPAYYAACSAGGVFSCGLTHMAVTPLDLVKCNMQVCIS
jgi:hypothetical protein